MINQHKYWVNKLQFAVCGSTVSVSGRGDNTIKLCPVSLISPEQTCSTLILPSVWLSSDEPVLHRTNARLRLWLDQEAVDMSNHNPHHLLLYATPLKSTGSSLPHVQKPKALIKKQIPKTSLASWHWAFSFPSLPGRALILHNSFFTSVVWVKRSCGSAGP